MIARAFRDIWARAMFLMFSAGECNLGTLKTSRVTIYHEMHERSYDFLFLIFSTKLLKNPSLETTTA